MITHILEKKLTNKKLVRPVAFIINMALVYATWRLFKYGGEHYENFLWGGWEWLKDTQGNLISYLAAVLLRAMGYYVYQYERMITVDGYQAVFIGDLCLGIAPIVIFSGFVLTFGDHTRNKIWFIPLGIIIINIINVIRSAALVLVLVNYQKYFKLAHDNVYLYLTYGAIFVLLMWWMDKLAFKK